MPYFEPQKRTRRINPDKIVASEDNECMALVDYLNIRNLLFTHIPNETPAGKQIYSVWVPNRKSIMRNKDMGVNKGFPDYIIHLPAARSLSGKAIILAIEMKREYGGSISPEQMEWLECLGQIEGIHSTISRGYDEAKIFIDKYLK